MAKSTQHFPGVKIPALRARRAEAVNLMEPGPGTPWEDRGSLGLGKAFSQTCRLALRNPVLLMNSIRRPETASDGWGFAIWCAIMWGLSCIFHGCVYFLYLYLQELRTRSGVMVTHLIVNTDTVFLKWGLTALILPVAVLGLLKLGSRMFSNLVAAEETKGSVPPVLTFNILAYCLAPSILAPIPLVGPPLALGWILSLMIQAAAGRLHIKRAGAIVCSVLTFGSMLLLGLAAWLLVWWISNLSFSSSVEEIPPPQIRIRRAQ